MDELGGRSDQEIGIHALTIVHLCTSIIAMNGNEFLRKLRALGKAKNLSLELISKRGKGSHQTIVFGGKKSVIRNLPDELKTGTLAAMCAQLGIKKEDL